MMNRFLQSGILAVLFCASGLLNARAQSTNTNTSTFHTNLYLRASVSLTAYVQEFTFPNPTNASLVLQSVQPERISPKQFVEGLIADIPGGTNELQGATLLFRARDVGTSSEKDDFVLQKGTNIVSLDQTGTPWFQFANNNSALVKHERRGSRNTTNSLDYVDLSFSFGTTKASADLSGLTKLKMSSLLSGRQLLVAIPEPLSLTASIAGSGSFRGHDAVYKGTVTCSGRRVEVVQGP